MLMYTDKDSEMGDAYQSFVTVIRNSNAGLKYWCEQLTMSYIIIDSVGTAAKPRLRNLGAYAQWSNAKK